MILDSGNRKEFETGATRDCREGVGRCDLLPLDVVGEFYKSEILDEINKYIRDGHTMHLYTVLDNFINVNYDDIPTAMLDLAIHYEEGCRKYGDRNWEQGIPLHCFIDSAVRHYLKHMREDEDESHERAFMWNIIGAIWTHNNKPELIDLPFNKPKPGTIIKVNQKL